MRAVCTVKLKFSINDIWKNAKMCIFAQKRQHLLKVRKDSCLKFKCNIFQYLLAVCVRYSWCLIHNLLLIHYQLLLSCLNMSQTCPKHVPNMSQTWPKHVPNMSQRCPKDVPKMSQRCPKDVPNMSKTCPKHVPNMSQTCPKHIPTMSQTCP